MLDLDGLGSLEALRQRTARHADAQWMDRLMDAHHVSYAVIYDPWFPQRPADFIKVANFVLDEDWATVAEIQVAMYARDSAHAKRLAPALRQYAEAHSAPTYHIDYAPAFTP